MRKRVFIFLLLAVSLFFFGCLNYFVSPPPSPGEYNAQAESAPFSVLPSGNSSSNGNSSNSPLSPSSLNSSLNESGQAYSDNGSPASPKQDFPGATPTNEQQAQTYKIDSALAKNSSSFSYDEVISMNGIDVESARVYVKGNKTRRESNAGWGENESEIVTLIDSEAGTVYFINEQDRTASRLKDQNPETYASAYPAQTQGKETDLGIEQLFGVQTEVYEYSDTSSGETVTAWVWKDKGIILKMQVDTQYGSAIIQAKNMTFSELPDSLFQVPPDIVVKDVAAPPLNQ